MIPLLLALLLAGPQPTVWAERDGNDLRITADLRPLWDAPLRRRLKSGLTTTLRLRVRLEALEEEIPHGEILRVMDVRWDLWEGRLEVWEPGREPTLHDGLEPFLEDFGRLRGALLARAIPRDDQAWRVVAVLDVNPLTPAQVTRQRSWLTGPRGLDPLSGRLFGSFVRLFDNFKPGPAERTLRLRGQPFRGDRLPFWRGEVAP